MNTIELMYKNKYLCLGNEGYYLSDSDENACQFDVRCLTKAKEDGEYGLCNFFMREGNIDDSHDGEVTCMELNYAELKVNFILS